jgi:hypothetical protein
MREDKVLAAVRACGARGGTIAELVPVAYDDAPSSVWPFAMLSLAAHIEKLEREGRVRREDDRFVATVDPTEAS